MLSNVTLHLLDTKHGLCIVAGDVYDGHVYHQRPEGRQNALWRFEPVAGDRPDVYRIRDMKHGKYLVAGDVYDGNVYHQDHQGRENACWRVVTTREQGREVVQLLDERHHRALVAGDVIDQRVYHQDPQGRANARWLAVEPTEMNAVVRSALQEVHCEYSAGTDSYNLAIRSQGEAAASGWDQKFVAFVAYATLQPGTVPIYRETPIASPGSHHHFWNRTPAEAAQHQWQPTGVAFYAFKDPAPGTVPVYRDERGGKYFFSTRHPGAAESTHWTRVDVAFHAYPADTLRPYPQIALRAHGGQFVHVGADGRTLTAETTSLGGWETFQCIPVGHDHVGLRAANGMFVTAWHGGGGPLWANQTSIGVYETFRVHDMGTGGVALQTFTGHHVCAEGGGGQPLVADRSQALGWETFAVVPLPAPVAAEWFPGALKWVECGADGTVWGVNVNNAIFRRTGAGWQDIGGVLAQISVGSATQVWGVNPNNDVFRWTGSGWEHQSEVKLRQVAVAADGTVWGLAPGNAIHRRVGPGDWQHIPGELKQISVASASLVWGTNSGDMIYRWTPGGWQQIAGKLRHVAVAADGSVAGVTPAGAVVRWLGGDRWEALPFNLRQLSVGSAGVMWGVDDRGQIVHTSPESRTRVDPATLVPIHKLRAHNNPDLVKPSAQVDPTWHDDGPAFVAHSAPQPGTVAIHVVVPHSDSVRFDLSYRGPGEAHTSGWGATGEVFHAFAWPAPGTAPVYRERRNGHLHFSLRSAEAAAAAGFEQLGVAFHAYPVGTGQPRTGVIRIPGASTHLLGEQFIASDGKQPPPAIEIVPASGSFVRLRFAGHTWQVLGDVFTHTTNDPNSDAALLEIEGGSGVFRLRTPADKYVYYKLGELRVATRQALTAEGLWDGATEFQWMPYQVAFVAPILDPGRLVAAAQAGPTTDEVRAFVEQQRAAAVGAAVAVYDDTLALLDDLGFPLTRMRIDGTADLPAGLLLNFNKEAVKVIAGVCGINWRDFAPGDPTRTMVKELLLARKLRGIDDALGVLNVLKSAGSLKAFKSAKELSSLKAVAAITKAGLLGPLMIYLTLEGTIMLEVSEANLAAGGPGGCQLLMPWVTAGLFIPLPPGTVKPDFRWTDLGAATNKYGKQFIADSNEFFRVAASGVDQGFNWVKREWAEDSAAVAGFFRDVGSLAFQTRDGAARQLRAIGFGATATVQAIVDVYDVQAAAAAQSLRSAGYAGEQISSAIKTTFAIPDENQLRSIVETAGIGMNTAVTTVTTGITAGATTVGQWITSLFR